MLKKPNKPNKRPKYPTKLEESMLKRKNREFVCTCYGEIEENASLPSDIEEEVAGAAPPRRCRRLHATHPTPEQARRRMDEQRDRAALMAELADLIGRRSALLRERKNRKKKENMKKNKTPERDSPCWYQELSSNQMSSVEMLGSALMADMEEGSLDRTERLLGGLGLAPAPPRRILRHIMANCYTSPVLFLLYLALSLEPKFRPLDASNEAMYAVRERIVLSCLAHLLIPRTLFDLHYLLPLPEIKTYKDEKIPVSFQLRKKMQTSPYLQPQPMFVEEYMNQLTSNAGELIAKLETKGIVHVPTHAEFNLESSVELSQLHINYHQRRYNHFCDVKYDHQLRAAHSYIKINRNYGIYEEIENSFYRQMSYLPQLMPQFPNETYPFLRYSTSTEPPDTSGLAQLQEPRDQTFEPMMSFRHCASSWDGHRQRPGKCALQPPLSEVKISDETSAVQVKALQGYWHAYPRTQQHAGRRRPPLTTTDPVDSKAYTEYLKNSLQYLADKGNPLAALPDAHLLPHIQKWILKRNRFRLTFRHKCQLWKMTNHMFEKERYKAKLIPLPPLRLPRKAIGQLTWDNRALLGKLADKAKKKFYGQLQTCMVNDARKFWQIMCMKYFDNRYFRDTFLAYLPCRQTDVHPLYIGGPPCQPQIYFSHSKNI